MVDNKFCFISEWYDPQACLIRTYNFFFYPIDNSIELHDLKTKKHFLKRCKYENLRLADLFIGNNVNILSRAMKITEFGDDYTRHSLGKHQEKTFGIILSGHFNKIGNIIDSIYKANLKITKIKKVQLSLQNATFILAGQKQKSNYTTLANALSNAPISLIELLGMNSNKIWKDTIGAGDLTYDLELEALSKLFDGVFSGKLGTNTATYNDCTCCVIKPHIISAGMLGAVIYEIQKAGFEISAIQSFNMTKPNAEEFYEVYKGVVQEYPQMVDELITGLCVGLEIRAQDAQQVFRNFCGPHDPEIARALRPKTLRALFGIDRVKNAVHCTDLPEDNILEVEYLFRILDTV